MRRYYAKFSTLFLCLMFILFMATPVVLCEDLDSLNNGGENSQQEQQSNGGGTGDDAFDSITDYMRGYNAVDDEDMSKASKMTNPITNFVGTLIGIIILLTDAFLFLTTAVDLMYIGVPFMRKYLAPGADAQAGGGAMGGMGGMGGMGMRGGMMGGMGGMGGGAQASPRKWISDEALMAVQTAGGGAQAGGGMGGMGMGGMGMMGGMGGMGGGAQQQQSTGSVIGTYLKKRIFFLIVFAVATTLLMSSVFMDCGLNLAQLGYKIMEMLNSGLSNVEM